MPDGLHDQPGRDVPATVPGNNIRVVNKRRLIGDGETGAIVVDIHPAEGNLDISDNFAGHFYMRKDVVFRPRHGDLRIQPHPALALLLEPSKRHIGPVKDRLDIGAHDHRALIAIARPIKPIRAVGLREPMNYFAATPADEAGQTLRGIDMFGA
jgi:hypothetical protein